jgi:hypothetical protein
MAKSLVPAEFKTHIIDQFLESITEPANTVYYGFIGNHVVDGSTIDEIDAPVETVRKMNTDAFRDMIIGKKMTDSDFRFVVDRHDWQSGTAFTMYDDTQSTLFDSNFYTVVDEDSFKHVYKCLSNANGAVSTSKPLFQDARYDADLFVSGDDYYETNDGYQWKYLYSIDSLTFSKYATQKYIPIVANTVVESNSRVGSIDVIRVITHGKNYNNYITGEFSENDFNRITPDIAASAAQSGQALSDPAGDISVNQWYRIRAGRNIVDFYKNCLIYLSSGTGAGQYRQITRSDVVTGVGVVVYVAEQFTTPPDDTTTYEIFPEVEIIGDGTETVKAFARAVVNADASNSIHRIEMFDVGANYKFASAAVLTGAPDEENGVSIATIAAQLRAIIPPQGGHGANTAVELGAKRLATSIRFNRDETGLVSAENSFSQFGIIRDPLFANVHFFYENATQNYITNESVVQFKKLLLEGSFTANTTQDGGRSLLRASGTSSYDKFLKLGDKLYIRTVNGTGNYIGTVGVGSNTTAILLANAIPFMDAGINYDLQVYQADIISSCVVDNIAPPEPAGTPASIQSFTANKVIPKFIIGENLYGMTSRAVSNVTAIDINNRIGTSSAEFNFADFNQMFKVQGSVTAGEFQLDEEVYQLNPITGRESTAYIHSWNQDELSLTRVSGDFITSGGQAVITGRSSGATFDGVVTVYNSDLLDIKYGDIDPNEGSIIYIQNDVPISRDENQTEEIRVILEF